MSIETVTGTAADYGYATIEQAQDGTWTVVRCTWRRLPPFGASRHEQATGLSRADAEARACEWADYRPAPGRRQRAYCHWCGMPTHRVGRRPVCDECGEQF